MNFGGTRTFSPYQQENLPLPISKNHSLPCSRMAKSGMTHCGRKSSPQRYNHTPLQTEITLVCGTFSQVQIIQSQKHASLAELCPVLSSRLRGVWPDPPMLSRNQAIYQSPHFTDEKNGARTDLPQASKQAHSKAGTRTQVVQSPIKHSLSFNMFLKSQ